MDLRPGVRVYRTAGRAPPQPSNARRLRAARVQDGIAYVQQTLRRGKEPKRRESGLLSPNPSST